MLGRRHESRLLWIFGSPRSGSTWLLNLLASSPYIDKHDEPGIGIHLGVSIESIVGVAAVDSERFRAFDMRRDNPRYFFSDEARTEWEEPLRRLLLSRLRTRNAWLAIKEPHGSDAADLLLSVLPRARCLFLLRDGRDVVDSELDAVTSDAGWTQAVRRLEGGRLEFIQQRAQVWLRRTAVVEKAFWSHPRARRMMVRYEDLLSDPGSHLASIASWLEVEASDLKEAAERLAFDKLPAEKRGSGQFARSATPGAWRANMSAEEGNALESVLGEKVRSLGYS